MPVSITRNVKDPAHALPEARKRVFATFMQESAVCAVFFGGNASRREAGLRPLINTVPSHEVLVRKVQSGEVDAPATIDPAASNTTSVSTTVPSLLTSLIGTLALLYDTFPKTLYEEIHAGDDAQNPYEDIAFSSMVLRMLRKFLDIFWGTGASNDPDGLGKWLSATANKWGLNTTTSANYWFRSHTFT